MDLLQADSSEPLYSQLRDSLRARILNEEFADNKLPSEPELCSEYNVSRITVRQALADLQREGHIYRRQGRGTFVKPPHIEQTITHFFSFSNEMEKRGLKARAVVLDLKYVIPPSPVAQKLRLPRGERAIYLERLRYAEDTLIMMQYTHLPGNLFPDMVDKDLTNRKLYDVMREDYNVHPYEADLHFAAALLTERELEFFKVDPATPVMQGERLTFSQDGRVIEHTVGPTASQHYNYHVHIKQP